MCSMKFHGSRRHPAGCRDPRAVRRRRRRRRLRSRSLHVPDLLVGGLRPEYPLLASAKHRRRLNEIEQREAFAIRYWIGPHLPRGVLRLVILMRNLLTSRYPGLRRSDSGRIGRPRGCRAFAMLLYHIRCGSAALVGLARPTPRVEHDVRPYRLKRATKIGAQARAAPGAITGDERQALKGDAW
jgi:hypothetical protein